jgi:predicted RNA-binding protein with PUA-like domain
MPNCWLVKSEPSAYPFSQLVAERRTAWTGIRNNAARLHLLAMKAGDGVLFYHSGEGKEVVGTARVVAEAYPDPTAEDPRWMCVDIEAGRPVPKPVPLATFRADPILAETRLVKESRLSVSPLTGEQFARVLELAGLPPDQWW